MSYYLAIDLGASSGRHIIAQLSDGKLEFEEIHRFKNEFTLVDGVLCWDTDYLFNEIKEGMKKCVKKWKIPEYVGIDTWGVDYVLLNWRDEILGKAVSYRDGRTKGAEERVFEIIPEDELYQITGTQRQPFNTIFQLYASKLQNTGELQDAETLLMLPCYFNFLLTGIKANERTIASTSGLTNAKSNDWDDDIISRLGFPRRIFTEIKPAGTVLGKFTDEVAEAVGFSATVMLTTAHDTASSVLAAPMPGKSIYLSSGTWSLMGVETDSPVINEESMKSNFTNESGYGGKNRFIKNIVGLWMLQALKRECGNRHSYVELSRLAKENEEFPSSVDISDNRFLAPKSMIDEVRAACAEAGKKVPKTIGETCAVIYRSLSEYYGKTARDIETLTGESFDVINIVGGGSRDRYLDSLTAASCGKKVIVGPSESAALGNIAVQMIVNGELKDARHARETVSNSVNPDVWNELGEFVNGTL